MAKALVSPLLTAIKGKVGNTVFYGPSSRLLIRVQRSKRPTALQYRQRTRNNYRSLTNVWNGQFSQSDRDSWSATAAANPIKDVFNNDLILNGFQFFIRMNLPLLTSGISSVLTPPTDFSTTALVTFAASADSGTPFLQIDSLSPTLSAPDVLVVGVKPFLRPGQTSPIARLARLESFPAPLSFPLALTVPFLARYGSIRQNQGFGLVLHTLRSDTGAYAKGIFSTIVAS